jgi:undecaprenyl diphosphate synthase
MAKFEMENIPTHIAIIMDGNGRWARMRNLPRLIGHKQGVKTVKKIVSSCSRLGVKYLTLYAFSTENWKRPKIEVQGLMRLLKEFLRKEIEEMDKNNVRLMTIGDISKLPEFARQELKIAKQTLNDNKGLTVILALNYGAKSEIIDAIKRFSKDCMNGILNPENLDENIFSKYLYTAGLPDPDLLIRTSGQMRISNFLLWQTSYTELYFTDKLWPDFDEEDLTLAIEDYSKRKRRFGGL